MMTSPPLSSSEPSAAFSLLDSRIQRWIWEKGWTELRDAQERAIPVIMEQKRDVIISAATAAGKTEAAFLPILTRLVRTEPHAVALYIGPLKALINDQWMRLESLCKDLEVEVTPWHGDISTTKKQKFYHNPTGCLLITPESLEGLLIRDGHGLAKLFGGLVYIVVDELHAFIDTERGKQLQSLMHRIEVALGRRIVRVALSATLGDMALAAEFLRQGSAEEVELIEDRSAQRELRVVVKGYLDLPPRMSAKERRATENDGGTIGIEDVVSQGKLAISEDLYRTLRGSHNLVFPNSRAKVEEYADLLRRACESASVPNEFWPHHGSLSKQIREETEQALKDKGRPATAIATTTLELGIDIGSVRSIAQIGPAPSVASLMQRLGRSGREKGQAAILRCYCLEPELDADSTVSDQLRESLVQVIAQVRLVVQRWFEPPSMKALHLSTLFQQLLSLLGQYGGLTAPKAWDLLIASGVFHGLTKADFATLLRGLAERDVIAQDSSGLLLPGILGERILNHYSFLAAFTSEEEFRVQSAGKQLGTLPISRPLVPGSYIVFAGRRWKVLECNAKDRVIDVEPAIAGRPPKFDGMGGRVHDHVRQEMRRVLQEDRPLPYLDQNANARLLEARDFFKRYALEKQSLISFGSEVRVVTWSGDAINDTLVLMLKSVGLEATNDGLAIAVQRASIASVQSALSALATVEDDPVALVAEVQNLIQDKWDEFVPEALLRKSFAARSVDIVGARNTASRIADEGK